MAEQLPAWAVPVDQAPQRASLPSWAKLVDEPTAAHVAQDAGAPPGVAVSPANHAPSVPSSESAARGAFQGLSMGWGDEGSAAIAAAFPFTDREAAGPGATVKERYEHARDFYRRLNVNAESANPGTYTTGLMAGAVAPAIVSLGTSATPSAVSGTRALLQAAGQGVVAGAGYSDAPTASGVASDSALGGALGLAGYGVGKAVSAATGAVRAKAGEAIARAQARAVADAAAKEGKILASEVGSLGGQSAALNNDVKWVQILQEQAAKGELSPENVALLDSLRSSPKFAAVLNKAAERVGEELPQRVAKVTEKEAIVSGLQAAMPQAVAEGAAVRAAPSAMLGRIGAIAKRELSPVVGAAVGNYASDQLGLDKTGGTVAGGLAGVFYSRGRLGKSLHDLQNMPSTQIFLNGLVNRTAAIPQALAPYVPSLANAASRGGASLGVTHFLLYSNDEQYRRALDHETQPGKLVTPAE